MSTAPGQGIKRHTVRWALLAALGSLLMVALLIEYQSRRRLEQFVELTAREREDFEAKQSREVYVHPVSGDARQALDAVLRPIRVPHSVAVLPKHLAQASEPAPADEAVLNTLSSILPVVQRALHMDHRSGTHTGSRSTDQEFSFKSAYAVHAALARAGEKQLGSARTPGTLQILDALVLGAEIAHQSSLFPSLVGASMVEGSCAQIERLWDQLDPELRRSALAHTTLPSVKSALLGEKIIHFATLLRESQSTFGAVDGIMLAGPPVRKQQIASALNEAERFFAEAIESLSNEPPDIRRCEQAYSQLEQTIGLGSLQPVNVCHQVPKLHRAQRALARLRDRV